MLRIVHSPAPTDAPADDLHIWTPTNIPFDAWWHERGKPYWVGIDVGLLYKTVEKQYTTLYGLFASEAYKDLTVVVVYADVRWNDAEGEAPCGCMNSPCDYHRHGEGDVATCGCSKIYSIKCPYHAELDA